MTKSPAADLLASPKARLLLAVYEEPATPSEIARKLQMPANTVHYWTRRLLAGGLLEQTGQEGRSKTYRSLPGADVCEPEACAPFVHNVMQALSKVVMSAAEHHDLSEEPSRDQRPEIGVHELRIRIEDLPRIKKALQAAMPTSDDHEPEAGEVYTVSFIVTPGSLSTYF